ncbi:MAG: cell division protein SepF [Actinomycetes bacterium]
MSNWMKNARTWLGLGNEEFYDDDYYGDPADAGYEDDYYDEPEPARPAARPQSQARPQVRAVPAGASDDWEQGDGGVRVLPASDGETRSVVRPLPSNSNPHVVTVRAFNDVQEIADTFKRSQPVILNLGAVDKDLSRRVIDFASGLCYGLEGNMERVAEAVFLVTPQGASISDADRRRYRSGDLGD